MICRQCLPSRIALAVAALFLGEIDQVLASDKCSFLFGIISSSIKTDQTGASENWSHLEKYRQALLSSTRMTPEGIIRVLFENKRRLYHTTNLRNVVPILRDRQLRWLFNPDGGAGVASMHPDKVFFHIADRRDVFADLSYYRATNKAPEDGTWLAGHPASRAVGRVVLEFDPESLVGNNISHWLLKGRGYGDKGEIFAETDIAFSKLMSAAIEDKTLRYTAPAETRFPEGWAKTNLGAEFVVFSPFQFERRSVTVYMSQSHFLSLSQKDRNQLKAMKINLKLREDLNRYRVPQKGLTLNELSKCSNPDSAILYLEGRYPGEGERLLREYVFKNETWGPERNYHLVNLLLNDKFKIDPNQIVLFMIKTRADYAYPRNWTQTLHDYVVKHPDLNKSTLEEVGKIQ